MKPHSATWLIIIFPLATGLTSANEPAVREILTSQQLFVTKLMPSSGKSKSKRQEFEGELRDAFKVIKYKGDSSYVELDWTLCPDGKCPETGQFEEGPPRYKMIDSLINLKLVKR
jgi:hypothetical protein